MVEDPNFSDCCMTHILKCGATKRRPWGKQQEYPKKERSHWDRCSRQPSWFLFNTNFDCDFTCWLILFWSLSSTSGCALCTWYIMVGIRSAVVDGAIYHGIHSDYSPTLRPFLWLDMQESILLLTTVCAFDFDISLRRASIESIRKLSVFTISSLVNA